MVGPKREINVAGGMGDFFDTLKTNPPPLVAVGGPERVFVDEAVAMVRKSALAGAMADFNHDRLDAKSVKGSDIVNTARLLPTMAKRRLVEVHNADDIREDALKALAPYLDAPCPETCLLFVFGKFDKRQKSPKAIGKAALSMRFDHPKERDMPSLVGRRARKHKLQLDEEAAMGLAVTVGTDLGFLERALEKLALVNDDERVLTMADISLHVADTHLEDSFTFVRHVAQGDAVRAFRSLSALEKNRAAPLALVGLMAWQLRQVLRARAMLDAGEGEHSITKTLRAFGPRGGALMRAARAFDTRGHERRLGRLAYVDQTIKSAPVNGFRLLERVVFDLCPPRRRRPARSSRA